MDSGAGEKTRLENDGGSGALNLCIPASAEYVLLARLVVAHVGQIAGFGPEEVYDLKLAVTEAATNVIRHAEVDSFEISYSTEPGRVEITVTDTGRGFEFSKHQPGSQLGGFGLSVIRNLVDQLTVDSGATGTSLTMTRNAGAKTIGAGASSG